MLKTHQSSCMKFLMRTTALFAVGAAFLVVPVLAPQAFAQDTTAESYTTADGTTWSYSQNNDVWFVNAQDVRGITTSYQYNRLGQVTKEVSGERGTVHYSYNDAGQITRKEMEGGLVFELNYDGAGRVSHLVARANGTERKVIRYVYDNCVGGEGRICKIVHKNADGDHISRYAYDDLGRLTKSETRYDDTADYETTRYNYDDEGRLTRLRYPTGLVVRYHHNADGRVHKVTGRYETGEDRTRFIIADNISIIPNALAPSELTFGNGLTTQRSYGKQGLASIVTDRDGDVLDSANYNYDAEGKIAAISRLDSTLSQNFVYDDMGRLVSEILGNQRTDYVYDGVNNRTSRTQEGKTRHYTYAPDSNRIIASGNQGFAYDFRGNIVEDRGGKRSFDYNATNRMSAFYKDGELKASYRYNAFGQRIEKVIHGTQQAEANKSFHFAYSPSGTLLSEWGRKENRKASFARDFIWIGNTPIAQVQRKIREDGTTQKAKVTYIHTDHLGAPATASDEEGNIIWRWDRDAYGVGKLNRDVDGDGEKTTIRLRFPGQYHDPESGLFYNHYRDYDPKVGRYIQSDPIGLLGGVNRYAYVSGNPVNYIDSNGLSAYLPSNCYSVEDDEGVTTVCQKPPSDEPNYLDPLAGRGVITWNQLTSAESEVGDSADSAPDDNGAGIDNNINVSEENYCNADNSDVSSRNGTLVALSNGNLSIRPRSRSVPNLSIPNTVLGLGFSTRNFNDHVYNVETSTIGLGLTPENVANSLINNPTPGADQPATPNGTLNNVGFIPPLYSNNFVRSFSVPSPNNALYTEIVVNYTVRGMHALGEGYVIRYGEIRNGEVVAIRSYGEGHAWQQDPALESIWCTPVKNVWGRNHQEIINSSKKN